MATAADLAVSMLPIGDVIDIAREVSKWIRGKEMDWLVLGMATAGVVLAVYPPARIIFKPFKELAQWLKQQITAIGTKTIGRFASVLWQFAKELIQGKIVQLQDWKQIWHTPLVRMAGEFLKWMGENFESAVKVLRYVTSLKALKDLVKISLHLDETVARRFWTALNHLSDEFGHELMRKVDEVIAGLGEAVTKELADNEEAMRSIAKLLKQKIDVKHLQNILARADGLLTEAYKQSDLLNDLAKITHVHNMQTLVRNLSKLSTDLSKDGFNKMRGLLFHIQATIDPNVLKGQTVTTVARRLGAVEVDIALDTALGKGGEVLRWGTIVEVTLNAIVTEKQVQNFINRANIRKAAGASIRLVLDQANNTLPWVKSKPKAAGIDVVEILFKGPPPKP